MTKNDIVQTLLSSLGGGRVNIEVNQDHIDTAITLSLLWLSVYASQEHSIVVTTSDGGYRIDLSGLPSDIVVTDVITTDTGISSANVFADFCSYDIYTKYSYDVVDISVLQNYFETRNKVLGQEFQWKFQYPFIYLNKPLSSIAEVRYITGYKSVEEIPQKYLPFFIKYAKAELKEIVGRVRSKYKNVPSPEGTIEMDGEDLIQEAQTEKQEATEGLKAITQRGIIVFG